MISEMRHTKGLTKYNPSKLRLISPFKMGVASTTHTASNKPNARRQMTALPFLRAVTCGFYSPGSKHFIPFICYFNALIIVSGPVAT